MSYPQLHEDNTRNDWESASYQSKVKVDYDTSKVTAQNDLSNSEQLRAFIDDGSAVWQLEIRCPRTLYSVTTSSQEPKLEVAWNTSEFLGPVFFFTGLYATQDLTISTSELTSIWRDTDTTTVPKGWQLVRSIAWSTETDLNSILKFSRNEDMNDGTMQVREDTSTGSLEFIVDLAANIFDEMREDRTLQIAALIGAMSKLQGKEWDTPDSPYKPMKKFFEDRNLVAWNESDFDPAETATSIEPFQPAYATSAEDDDG